MRASRLRGRWLVLGCLVLLAACTREAKRAEVEMEVQRVALDDASQSPVVLLADREHTVALPIWVGPAEAQAIAMRMQGVAPPRPMTHDLLKNVFDSAGLVFDKVLIHDLRDNTYYARIFVSADGKDLEIDSRPSDAIALALRFERPIFVSTALLEKGNAIDLRAARAADTLTVGGVTVQVLSRELAEHFDLSAGKGVLVSAVSGSASSALHSGDVILEVDGEPVSSVRDFESKIKALQESGDLYVQRNGERVHVAFAAAAAD